LSFCNERNNRGVKIRADGKGDSWAMEHRNQLGSRFYLQDFDCMFGFQAFGSNTGEKLFAEYVPDSYENRQNYIRDFCIIALFDRKRTESAAFNPANMVSTQLYLWVCNKLSVNMPVAARFFYVIGCEAPPWTMIEIDTSTGLEVGDRESLSNPDWKTIWDRLGLTEARNVAAKFLQSTAGP